MESVKQVRIMLTAWAAIFLASFLGFKLLTSQVSWATVVWDVLGLIAAAVTIRREGEQ